MIGNNELGSKAPDLEATHDVEATPAMIRAGVARLSDLLEAGTGSAYVVSEVWAAMERARVAQASP